MKAIVPIALLIVCAGCGGPSSGLLGPTMPDNRPQDVQKVLARLRAAPQPESSPLLVGLTAEPSRLYAYDLDANRKLWERPVQARSEPHIAGSLVVVHESTGVVVRDLTTGETRFTVDDEALHLVGAAGDSRFAAISLSTGGGVGAHSKLVIADRGALAWSADLDYPLGAPAVRGGMVFVPWSSQNLSVIDAERGEELARVRPMDAVVGHAVVQDGDVYYGQQGLFRLGEESTSGRKTEAGYFEPELGELPGSPGFLRNAYQPPPRFDSAMHRIRLDWHARSGQGRLGVQHDTVFLVFYKLVFALSPQGDEVRWVHSHDADLVGGTVRPNGVLLADAKGRLLMLDPADGRPRWHHDTDTTPVVARFRGEGFTNAGSPQGQPLPLADQLLAAAEHSDARLVPGQVLALRFLAALPEPEVTNHLIALCDENGPQPVIDAACGALARRESGAEHVLRALERRAAFLELTTAPPVGPLARAAVKMELKQAVPQLITHLRDPNTPEADLQAVVSAIETLGDRSAADPLRDFLLLYHADPMSDDFVAALQRTTSALVTLEGPVAQDSLQQVESDPLGIPAVRSAARKALAELRQSAKQASDEDADDEDADDETAATEQKAPPETDEDELPRRVTGAIAARVLDPVEADLQQCLRQDAQKPSSARVLIGLEGDGAISIVSVSPDRLEPCIEPLIRSRQFPANRRHRRQRVIYTVRGR